MEIGFSNAVTSQAALVGTQESRPAQVAKQEQKVTTQDEAVKISAAAQEAFSSEQPSGDEPVTTNGTGVTPPPPPPPPGGGSSN